MANNHKKNEFYRNYYQKVFYVFTLSIIILLIAISVVFYQVLSRALPQFSAVTTDGHVMPLLPYNEPNLLPSTILRWASKAAVAAYTFDFVDYNREVELAHPYFTSGGWIAYQNAISDVIQRVTKGQLFVNGVVAGTPVITNQGDLPGMGYSWQVQIPFLVTYQSAEQVESKRYLVRMSIVKVPTELNADAIGIETFVLK